MLNLEEDLVRDPLPDSVVRDARVDAAVGELNVRQVKFPVAGGHRGRGVRQVPVGVRRLKFNPLTIDAVLRPIPSSLSITFRRG